MAIKFVTRRLRDLCRFGPPQKCFSDSLCIATSFELYREVKKVKIILFSILLSRSLCNSIYTKVGPAPLNLGESRKKWKRERENAEKPRRWRREARGNGNNHLISPRIWLGPRPEKRENEVGEEKMLTATASISTTVLVEIEREKISQSEGSLPHFPEFSFSS